MARRLGAVDAPGPRRVHLHPTPGLGGLAVLGAVAGTLALDHLAGGSAATILATPGRSPALLVAGFGVVLATGPPRTVSRRRASRLHCCLSPRPCAPRGRAATATAA